MSNLISKALQFARAAATRPILGSRARRPMTTGASPRIPISVYRYWPPVA